MKRLWKRSSWSVYRRLLPEPKVYFITLSNFLISCRQHFCFRKKKRGGGGVALKKVFSKKKRLFSRQCMSTFPCQSPSSLMSLLSLVDAHRDLQPRSHLPISFLQSRPQNQTFLPNASTRPTTKADILNWKHQLPFHSPGTVIIQSAWGVVRLQYIGSRS